MLSPIIIFLQLFITIMSESVDTQQYYRMPKLFKYDGYDECLGIFKSDAVYCIANAEILPDSSSTLYNYIIDYSSDQKHHYRHEKLTRGLCINDCIQLVGNSTENEFENLNIVDKTSVLNYFKADYFRMKYNSIVNKCINKELTDMYKLKASTNIEYCIDSDHQDQPIDQFDIIVAVITLGLLIIVIISSLYDRYLRNTINIQVKAANHYNSIEQLRQHQRILTTFSIRRNWYILSLKSKKEFRDFNIFQWMKTVMSFMVIMAHAFAFHVSFPSHNPIYIEKFYSRKASMFLTNGNYFVQVFFFMSGFLSAYLFQLGREKDKDSSFLYFIKAVIFRYIRIIPVFLFMMLIHATWLYQLGDGPFWDEYVLDDRQYCRKNWWINMLLLNNYIGTDEMCMFHTWYLSADFWLSVLGYLCLTIIIKYPKIKYRLVLSIIFTSLLVNGIVVYFNDLGPIFIQSPESFRNHAIATDSERLHHFRLSYIPTHMNMGTYFIGIMLSFWYRDTKDSRGNYRKYYYTIMWNSFAMVGFVLMFIGYGFYETKFQISPIWIAIVATITKHLWGAAFGACAIGIMYHLGWFLRNLMSHKGFKIFGRISFSAYICHVFILKILVMKNRQMIEMSFQQTMTVSVACFTLSNFLGFLLMLFIEIPASSLIKFLIQSHSHGQKFSKDDFVQLPNMK